MEMVKQQLFMLWFVIIQLLSILFKVEIWRFQVPIHIATLAATWSTICLPKSNSPDSDEGRQLWTSLITPWFLQRVLNDFKVFPKVWHLLGWSVEPVEVELRDWTYSINKWLINMVTEYQPHLLVGTFSSNPSSKLPQDMGEIIFR